ncbi:MAG: GNAT family N-acetyltransferase [Candidatus Hodarchaeales archaeon]|jgi:RimJ/RimL family protein N-acetyltransferase
MIKKLTIEDYPKIQALWEAAGLDSKSLGRDHPDRVKNQLKTNNVFFLGIEEDETLQGVILVSHDGRKGWLNRLTVHPRYRNRGLAQLLIKAAEDQLFNLHGIEVFCALIFDENKQSSALFEKVGYESLPEIRYYSKRKYSEA